MWGAASSKDEKHAAAQRKRRGAGTPFFRAHKKRDGQGEGPDPAREREAQSPKSDRQNWPAGARALRRAAALHRVAPSGRAGHERERKKHKIVDGEAELCWVARRIFVRRARRNLCQAARRSSPPPEARSAAASMSSRSCAMRVSGSSEPVPSSLVWSAR